MQQTCPGTRNSSFRSLQLADSAGVNVKLGNPETLKSFAVFGII